VIGIVVNTGLAVMTGALGHIDLAPNDGLYPSVKAGLIEADGAVHYTVIRHGDGRLAQLLGPGRQVLDTAGTV